MIIIFTHIKFSLTKASREMHKNMYCAKMSTFTVIDYIAACISQRGHLIRLDQPKATKLTRIVMVISKSKQIINEIPSETRAKAYYYMNDISIRVGRFLAFWGQFFH